MSQLNAEQWAEVQRLFARAAELPPGERTGLLERECADGDVLREVRSLLDYSGDDLHTAAAAIAAVASAVERETDPDQKLIGTRLGAFKVEAIAGHGGMGAVYRASRDDGEYRQEVAIKLVRAAAQSPGMLQRFKQERQILARLAHPNIARLLDGGSTADGVPYLVMEFIEGEPITAWCERQSLTVEQRLRLFLQVSEGVEFAHGNLVVHRDLKPGNILVTAQGVPKLLDFGIAKLLVSDADSAAPTATGMQAMTPEYAAPEQVRGDPVSKSVDVYALGLVLYEILTGRKAQQILGRTPAAVDRAVCQTEPPAPAALKPELAGDLDNIVRMALRKEPARRYASVADLARDIRLHLEKRAVSARPDTAAYRVSRFVRRNRAAATAAAITAIVCGGIGWVYWLGAPAQISRASRINQLTQTGHAAPSGGLAADGSHLYFIEESADQTRLSRIPLEGGSPQPLLGSLQDCGILDISPDRTKLLLADGFGAEAPFWEVPTAGGPRRRIGDVVGHTAAWSPDGKRIAFGRGPALFIFNADGTGLRKILDTPGNPRTLRWAPPPGPPVLRFAIRSMEGHQAVLWEVRADGTGAHPLVPSWESGAASMRSNDSGSWVAGGKYYLFRSSIGLMRSIWVMRENRGFLARPDRHPALIHSTSTGLDSFWPSPDGKRAFFISALQRLQFVRYDTARAEFEPFLAGVPGHALGFSKDGESLVYTTSPLETLWRSRTDGSGAVQLIPPSMRAYQPDWSPDGAWIAFTGYVEGQPFGIYVVPSAGGTPQRITPTGGLDDSVRWSPDGNTLLFYHGLPRGATGRQGLYLLDWKTRKTAPLPGSINWVRGRWSPDGSRIAATDDLHIEIFEMRTQRWKHLTDAKGVGNLLWSRNGRYLYFQADLLPEQPIFRMGTNGDDKVERLMSSKQIPQSDVSRYVLTSLDPADSPIASIVRSNADIYALDLDLP